MKQRKLESVALLLAVFGTLLIMPPLVLLFVHEGRLFGIPIPIVYLFAVWAVLVFGARRLAHLLSDRPRVTEADRDPR